MGWLSDTVYTYRRAITITEQSGQDLTNFQVKLTFDSSNFDFSKTISDGRDISFDDGSGNMIPHWIEEWDTVNQKGVVWVKLSSIPASGSVTIYMYYGSGNSGNSDGSQVFDFFDDFETWNGWTAYGSGVVSQSSTEKYYGNYSAKKDSNGDPNGAYKDLGFTLNYPFILEAYINRTYFSGADSDRIGVIDANGNGYGPNATMDVKTLRIDKRSSYSGSAYNSVTLSQGVSNDWYFIRFSWNNGSMKAEVFYNGSSLGSTTYTDSTTTAFTRAYIFGGYTYYIDVLRIRKYVSSEPTISVGTEELFDSSQLKWSYRRAITITENSGGTLTDYQVKITLDSNNFDFSKANSDGSDIRFTSDDGVTLLNYWIENWDDVNQQATIWVKVPSISANGTAVIYMYYGYTSADNIGNPSNVFDFYDTIENGDNWTFWGSPAGKVDTAVGNPKPSLKGNGDGYYHSGAVSKTSFDLNNGYALIFDGKHSSDLRRGGAGFSERNSFSTTDAWKDGLQLRLKFDEDSDNIGYVYYGVESFEDSLTANGLWRRYEVLVEPNGGKVHFIVDGQERWVTTQDLTPFVGYICVYGHDPEFWFDNIIVRRYTYPEPSYSIGSEEVPSLVKYWDGSQWVEASSVYYWDGSQWVPVSGIYYWDGTQWVAL